MFISDTWCKRSISVLILSTIGLLTACSTTGKPEYTSIDTAYRLQIEQPFNALPNGTYLDFQQGQLITPGNLDRWTTYCRLYVYNPDHGADYRSSVHPGSVPISKVKVAYHSSDYPVHGPARLSWGVRDLPAYYVYQVGMQLDAPDQPDLRSLVCYRKWAVPRVNQYPTLSEIRDALGKQIRIESL